MSEVYYSKYKSINTTSRYIWLEYINDFVDFLFIFLSLVGMFSLMNSEGVCISVSDFNELYHYISFIFPFCGNKGLIASNIIFILLAFICSVPIFIEKIAIRCVCEPTIIEDHDPNKIPMTGDEGYEINVKNFGYNFNSILRYCFTSSSLKLPERRTISSKIVDERISYTSEEVEEWLNLKKFKLLISSIIGVGIIMTFVSLFIQIVYYPNIFILYIVIIKFVSFKKFLDYSNFNLDLQNHNPSNSNDIQVRNEEV